MNSEEFYYCPRCSHQLELRSWEGRLRKICPACQWIGYENPLPCAAALVLNTSGEILLVRRGVEPARGEWALPSGFMEIDETPEQCCLRELEEETGLKGKVIRLIGVYAQSSARYKKVLIVGYEVEARGKPSPGSDSQAVAFFPPEKMPPIAFSSHRHLIEDFLISKNRRFQNKGQPRKEGQKAVSQAVRRKTGRKATQEGQAGGREKERMNERKNE